MTTMHDVDIEQFRRPLKVAREAMAWARNDDAVAECDRLLAIIDKHAAMAAHPAPAIEG